MVNVELEGIVPLFEDSKDQTGSKSWAVWRRLALRDLEKGAEIPDWFLVYACSASYLHEKEEYSDTEKKVAVVQDVFDEQALENETRHRFKSLNFVSWDDFYAKMSEAFIFEE